MLQVSPTYTPPNPGSTQSDPGTLASIFSPIYSNAKSSLDANYAQQMQKLRSNQAARGVLTSGVSDYPSTQLATANTNALGTVQSGLANILGNTEASRSLFNTQSDFEKLMAQLGYGNSLGLADKIGSLNKPSDLENIFSTISGGAGAIGSIASLF